MQEIVPITINPYIKNDSNIKIKKIKMNKKSDVKIRFFKLLILNSTKVSFNFFILIYNFFEIFRIKIWPQLFNKK